MEKNSYKYFQVNTVMRIKYCIKIGYTIEELMEHFDIGYRTARRFYLKYVSSYQSPQVTIGLKNEPYFEGDFLETPVYKLEDLTGEELQIAGQNIETKKLWTWEE